MKDIKSKQMYVGMGRSVSHNPNIDIYLGLQVQFIGDEVHVSVNDRIVAHEGTAHQDTSRYQHGTFTFRRDGTSADITSHFDDNRHVKIGGSE